MLQFLYGFIVALLIVVPAAILLVCKRASFDRKARSGQLERFEELSKLTGGLAHEIKNPLSTIKVNLKLAGEDLDDLRYSNVGKDSGKLDRAARKITVVQQEAGRLEHILESFLHYLDRTPPQLATVDINQLIGDMVDFYCPQAHSHSITIRQGLCGESLICRIDTDMIKQAILNLFINAQQAMTGGGELMIRTDRQNSDALIQISDTGCGIPAERQALVFDSYYSSRPNGSGLGLPTVRKIIETHHGSISLVSEPGKGTSFTIKLPLKELPR